MIHRLTAGFATLIFSLILALPAFAAQPKFPALTGRVVDDAGILSASTRSSLTETLAEHERVTGEQIVVVTLPSLQGLTIEDFGYQLGRYWGIGHKGEDNGVLLVVAPKERKVRIEVGYGLEGTLTDAASRTIIERDILPSFRSGDFNAGVIAGTQSILKVLRPNGVLQLGSYSDNPVEGNYLAPDWEILIGLVIWIILVIAIDSLGSDRDVIRRMGRVVGRAGTNYHAGWSGGGHGGGGGGGGGFSGGGGSFGGGGASGSW